MCYNENISKKSFKGERKIKLKNGIKKIIKRNNSPPNFMMTKIKIQGGMLSKCPDYITNLNLSES